MATFLIANIIDLYYIYIYIDQFSKNHPETTNKLHKTVEMRFPKHRLWSFDIFP